MQKNCNNFKNNYLIIKIFLDENLFIFLYILQLTIEAARCFFCWFIRFNEYSWKSIRGNLTIALYGFIEFLQR